MNQSRQGDRPAARQACIPERRSRPLISPSTPDRIRFDEHLSSAPHELLGRCSPKRHRQPAKARSAVHQRVPPDTDRRPKAPPSRAPVEPDVRHVHRSSHSEQNVRDSGNYSRTRHDFLHFRLICSVKYRQLTEKQRVARSLLVILKTEISRGPVVGERIQTCTKKAQPRERTREGPTSAT